MVFLLGSVASLVGSVVNSLPIVKNDVSINAHVEAKADVDVSLGVKARAKSKATAQTAGKSTAAAKSTNIEAKRRKKAMKTIISDKKVWRGSPLPGERRSQPSSGC
jgi:hypothetical protein